MITYAIAFTRKMATYLNAYVSLNLAKIMSYFIAKFEIIATCLDKSAALDFVP